ncbi:zinc finger protein 879-like [Symsagittifera roscoffensis]|uniref:zinc finger protein 879-like n=1 Tax=Symsagittifera roscoffensis TaxID=84072 RepID=UPI00307B42B0
MATSIDQSARLYPVRERVRLLNRLQCVNRHGQIAQVGAGGGGGQERQQQLPVVHMSSWGCGVNKRLCMQCGERSHSTSVVKAEPMGDKSKLYYCHACRCLIARAPMFTQHLKRHARCFVCPLPLCGLAKKTNDALLTHMFSHYGLKPYTCSICNKGFTSKYRAIDCCIGSYKCPICHKYLSSNASLKAHLARHSHRREAQVGGGGGGGGYRIPTRLLHCSHCGRQYTSKNGLRLHMDQVHLRAERKPFQCKFCLKKFARQENLKHHAGMFHAFRLQLEMIDVCVKGF